MPSLPGSARRAGFCSRQPLWRGRAGPPDTRTRGQQHEFGVALEPPAHVDAESACIVGVSAGRDRRPVGGKRRCMPVERYARTGSVGRGGCRFISSEWATGDERRSGSLLIAPMATTDDDSRSYQEECWGRCQRDSTERDRVCSAGTRSSRARNRTRRSCHHAGRRPGPPAGRWSAEARLRPHCGHAASGELVAEPDSKNSRAWACRRLRPGTAREASTPARRTATQVRNVMV
jgi:hypothetical protein